MLSTQPLFTHISSLLNKGKELYSSETSTEEELMQCVFELLHHVPHPFTPERKRLSIDYAYTKLFASVDKWLVSDILAGKGYISHPFVYTYLTYLCAKDYHLLPSFRMILRLELCEEVRTKQWNHLERKVVRWLDKYKRKHYFRVWMDLYPHILDKVEKGYLTKTEFYEQTEMYLDCMYTCMPKARPCNVASMFPTDATADEVQAITKVVSLLT